MTRRLGSEVLVHNTLMVEARATSRFLTVDSLLANCLTYSECFIGRRKLIQRGDNSKGLSSVVVRRLPGGQARNLPMTTTLSRTRLPVDNHS